MWKRERFGKLKFCPECGTESLMVDQNEHAPGYKTHKYFCEYICTLCGLGVRMQPSRRYQTAAELQNQMRKMRTPDL